MSSVAVSPLAPDLPVPNRSPLAFPAMVAGSAALAFGPWLVRLSDVSPVASGFWRMALAVLPLTLLARFARPGSGKGADQGADGTTGLGAALRRPATIGWAALAGVFFAADIAAWHLGIVRTTLTNAALLSNGASFLLPLWGIFVLRHVPRTGAKVAIACAVIGTLLLVGRSASLSSEHLDGDLFCLLAAVLYTAYLLVVDRLRVILPPLPLLAMATAFAALAMLPVALVTPGAFWPHNWAPVVLLSVGSQIIGQGLVVYAIRHLKPLVIGLTLLIQPAIATAIGALRFGEVPGVPEIAGAALVVAALVLVRLPERVVARPG